MSIQFVCPECGSLVGVDKELAGQTARCGGCGFMVRVPPGTNYSAQPEPSSRPSPPETDRYTYDDETRGRRIVRRMPPRRANGRSLLFWFLIITFGAGLCGCLTCGGLFLVFREPHWHTHTSPGGDFKVELPADAIDLKNAAGQELDPNVKVEGTILFGRLEEYAVIYFPIDPLEAGLTDDQVIDKTIKSITQAPENTPIGVPRPVKVGGISGKEFRITSKNVQTLFRITVANRQVYMVEVSSHLGSPDNERTTRFFDSFVFTEQALPQKKGLPKRAWPRKRE